MIQIERIIKQNPKGIILREKDLTEKEYISLSKSVMEICKKYHTPCILHSFVNVAKEMNCKSIHLPLPILRTLNEEERTNFTMLGTSCHSVEEAKEAERLGCTYIIAGHIFETDCKRGLEGRGLDFLHKICESVSIPVYAIGGIGIQNIEKVRKAGSYGVAIMSSIMACDNPAEYLAKLKETKNEI